MGFLRKIGRKIKKGFKKVMGGKFGKILGGVALAMMFYGGAQAMFGNTKWFQGLDKTLKSVKGFVTGTPTEAITKLETVAPADITLQASAEASKAAGKEALATTKFDVLKETIKTGATKTKDYLFPEGDTFIPDTIKTVGVSTLLAPKPDVDTGGYGRMPDVSSFQGLQNNYVTAVQNEIPQLQGSDFQRISNTGLYGTLSPNYLLEQQQAYKRLG